MDVDNNLKAEIVLPFPSKRHAEIVFQVLRVDKEPKRSGVQKEIRVEDTSLLVTFTAAQARQLRVAITSFFENINLISKTFEFCGEPISETYDHF